MTTTETLSSKGPSTAAPLPESEIPSHDELIARARALRPLLIANQEATEKNTFPVQEVQQAFIDAGFYKVLTPKRYGGYQMGPWTFLKLAIELARGCPSSAWCYTLGHSHAFTAAAYYSPEAQDELFADGGYLVAASFANPRGEAKRVDGGYIINGKFPYGSGSPYSNYYMGVVKAPAGSPHGPEGTQLVFTARRENYTLGDDWGENVLGMRGSGSATVTVTDAFVPDHLIISKSFAELTPEGGGTVGSRFHNDATYAMPQLGFATAYVPALEIGMGYGMLDAYEEVIKSRPPEIVSALVDPSLPKPKTKAEVPEFQRMYGMALTTFEAAEGIMKAASDELVRMAERGEIDMATNFKITSLTGFSGRLAWQGAQEYLWRTGGSSQTANTSRMQRFYRDMSMWRTAPGSSQRDTIAEVYAQIMLAGPKGA